MPFDLTFYLKIFWSRFPLFLVVFVTILAAGYATFTRFPKVYRAEASLLVENSQIPADLATSTINTDLSHQLQIIQQRLMTRGSLLELAHKFDLYGDQPDMLPDEIVSSTQDQIDMDLSMGRGRVTTLTITAEAADGATAANIVNELVTRALNLDAAFRTEAATDTLTFFEREVTRLGEALDQANTRILDFKNASVDALPETLDFRMSRQTQLQEQLSQARREIGQLGEQRRKLVDLFETTGRTNLPPQRALNPLEEELNALHSELREALAVFSEANPKVAMLRNRISRLEAELSGTSADSGSSRTAGESVFEAQLVEIDSQISSLEDSIARYDREIAELQSAIERTPTNAIKLNAMERERDNIQGQYDMAVLRLSTAATGERIEVLSKGQRLSLIEHASVPTKPDKPSKLMFAGGSLAGGLFLGLAAVLLKEILRPTIRRPIELTRKLGITPLGTLPYVETPGEIWRRRGMRLGAAVVIVAALVGGLLLLPEQIPQIERLANTFLGQVKL